MFGLKKKKYLEWYSKNEVVTEENVNEFITPATPRSSCWWSNLKSTINDGFSSQLDYVRHEHKNGNTNIFPTRATAKQCPAISNVLLNSYLIKSPSDIVITIDKECGFLWNSSNDNIEISTHPTEQFHTVNDRCNLFKRKMNLKFELPIYIKTEGVPYIYTQPIYHNDIWFDVAIGSITDKYTKGLPLNINVLVDIPENESVSYEIKAGDVLAYMWFPEKVVLKHTTNKFIHPLFTRTWSSKSMFN